MPQQPSGLTALGLLGHRPWAILDRNVLRNSVIGILLAQVNNNPEIQGKSRYDAQIQQTCYYYYFSEKDVMSSQRIS